MTALLNPKHELAAQSRAGGATIADAYRAAGFKYDGAGATRLFQRPEVIARVAEIVAEKVAAEGEARKIAIQKAGLTEEWIIERLKYLTEVSLRGQPVLDAEGVQIPGKFSGKRDGATAARCLELASKIAGIAINRHEHGQPGAFAAMADDQLNTEIQRMAHEMGYTRADLEAAGITAH